MPKYILSDIFKGDYPVSQYYGNNPSYYKQFGLAGHEGVDWAIPIGVEVLAPFDGQIIRDNDDPKKGAYGDLLVLWDSKQKCAVWFCHLSENWFSEGDVIKKGTALGKTGNSGNSTGPHLHVNFVETDDKANRLNTVNGYEGFLNILDPNIVTWKMGNTASKPEDHTWSDDTVIPFGDKVGDLKLGEARSRIQDLTKNFSDCDIERVQLYNQIDDLKLALTNAKKANETASDINIATIPTTILWSEIGKRILGR